MLILSFHSPLARLKMCFGIRLFNLEFFVLDALGRHPPNLHLWWESITDQACVEFRDTDIIKALVDVILWWCFIYVFDVTYADGMVGILSFLQDIALEGSDNR